MLIKSFIFFLVFGIIGSFLFKFQKKLIPKRYFYFSRLIDGIEDEISLLGLITRTLIPVIIGIIAIIVNQLFNIPLDGFSLGALVGFTSIFLIIWPDILNPELISPHFRKIKLKLFSLYILLIFSFTFFGGIGGEFGQYILINEFKVLQFFDVKSIFNGLIAAALYSAVIFFLKLFISSFKDAH